MGSAKERGEGFVPNIFEKLEGSWSQAAVSVQDDRNEGAARLLGLVRVGTEFGDLVFLPLNHGFA